MEPGQPGLYPVAAFTGFGPSAYLPNSYPSRVFCTTPGKTARLRTQVRQVAPHQPGVYGMVNAHEELIYVGKAKNLRGRLLSYFRPRSRAPKAGKILAQTSRIVWEVCPTEFVSLLRELELIRRWRPRFNVQGQPLRRRQTFLCLGRRPAPYAFLSAHPPRTATSVFGPIPAGRRAGDAVRRLNDCFQLRDCPQAVEIVFPDQGELFPQLRAAGCLRLDLGTCLGPCTGGCERSAYHARLKEARAFLTGTDLAPLTLLQEQMAQAAEAQQYERAASLRDRLAPLEWLANRLERLRFARQRLSFVYPVAETWYLIHGARTLAAVVAPTDALTKQQARAAIEAVYRTEGTASVREAYEHADGMMIVTAWFRKRPGELKRTLTPREALEWCGGRVGGLAGRVGGVFGTHHSA